MKIPSTNMMPPLFRTAMLGPGAAARAQLASCTKRCPPGCVTREVCPGFGWSLSGLFRFAALFTVLMLTIVGCRRSRPYDAAHKRVECIVNLKSIQGAKGVWMLEQRKTTNDSPPDSFLFGSTALIRERTTCPDGGTYTVGKAGEKAKCSARGHTL